MFGRTVTYRQNDLDLDIWHAGSSGSRSKVKVIGQGSRSQDETTATALASAVRSIRTLSVYTSAHLTKYFKLRIGGNPSIQHCRGPRKGNGEARSLRTKCRRAKLKG